jgi:hypothetical protein
VKLVKTVKTAKEKSWRIRQGDFWLQWSDECAGWGEESMATWLDEGEKNRVLALLEKRGLRGCEAESRIPSLVGAVIIDRDEPDVESEAGSIKKLNLVTKPVRFGKSDE